MSTEYYNYDMAQKRIIPSDSWHTVPRRKTGAPVLRYGPDSTATGVVATLPG